MCMQQLTVTTKFVFSRVQFYETRYIYTSGIPLIRDEPKTMLGISAD